MSLLYAISSRGHRTPLLPLTARSTRSQVKLKESHIDICSSSLEISSPPANNAPKRRPAHKRNTRRSQPSTKAIAASSSEGSQGTGEAADKDDEDGDDEGDGDEEPELLAPSHVTVAHEVGRRYTTGNNTCALQQERSLFSPSDDDDDVYHGVDEISDYEDDINEEEVEAQDLEDIMASDGEDDPIAIFDGIDGMSVFGFGEDPDWGEGPATFPENSDSTCGGTVQRRVHFPNDVGQPVNFETPISPLLTRALLPSALPANCGTEESYGTPLAPSHWRNVSWNGSNHMPRRNGTYFEDPEDSMLARELSSLTANTMSQATLLMRTYQQKHTPLQLPFTKPPSISPRPNRTAHHPPSSSWARRRRTRTGGLVVVCSQSTKTSRGPSSTRQVKRLLSCQRQALIAMTGSMRKFKIPIMRQPTQVPTNRLLNCLTGVTAVSHQLKKIVTQGRTARQSRSCQQMGLLSAM